MQRGLYSVRIFDGPDDDKGLLIHSAYTNELKAPFKIDKVLEGISSMAIRLPMNNPGWEQLKPYRTLIQVRDVRSHKTLFDGRVLKPTQQMKSDGIFSISYDCEDKKAYLRDSRQRYAKIQDTTIEGLFAFMIGVHNDQMPEHKQFKVGNVTVTNSTDNVYRYVGYEDTYTEIKDNLLDRLDGYLVVREEEDGTYLDYLAEVGEEKKTPITPKSNLKDFRRDIDPTGIITRVIPLGARIEAEEGETADASMPRIDAKSVNNGIDYFEDQDLIEEFGIIEGTIIFDDINDNSFLPIRAQEFFQSQRAARISYDLAAVNLDLVDSRFEAFEVGNKHPIRTNPGFNIDDALQIIGIGYDSENPQLHRLIIGDQTRSLSQYQVEMNRKSRRYDRLEGDLEAQRQNFERVRKNLNQQIQNVQLVIDNIDTSEIPALEQAIINLNAAVSDLADIVDDIDIPGLATEDEAGLLTSEDKRKLNRLTLTVQANLDAIKETVGLITLSDAIDLDQLKADVEELKNGGDEPDGSD